MWAPPAIPLGFGIKTLDRLTVGYLRLGPLCTANQRFKTQLR